jgi:chorismate-pyruvate lyase
VTGMLPVAQQWGCIAQHTHTLCAITHPSTTCLLTSTSSKCHVTHTVKKYISRQGSLWSCSLLDIVGPSVCQRYVLIFLCNILHVSSQSNMRRCRHICIRQQKLYTPLSFRMSTHDLFTWAGGPLAISLSQCYTNYGLR